MKNLIYTLFGLVWTMAIAYFIVRWLGVGGLLFGLAYVLLVPYSLARPNDGTAPADNARAALLWITIFLMMATLFVCFYLLLLGRGA